MSALGRTCRLLFEVFADVAYAQLWSLQRIDVVAGSMTSSRSRNPIHTALSFWKPKFDQSRKSLSLKEAATRRILIYTSRIRGVTIGSWDVEYLHRLFFLFEGVSLQSVFPKLGNLYIHADSTEVTQLAMRLVLPTACCLHLRITLTSKQDKRGHWIRSPPGTLTAFLPSIRTACRLDVLEICGLAHEVSAEEVKAFLTAVCAAFPEIETIKITGVDTLDSRAIAVLCSLVRLKDLQLQVTDRCIVPRLFFRHLLSLQLKSTIETALQFLSNTDSPSLETIFLANENMTLPRSAESTLKSLSQTVADKFTMLSSFAMDCDRPKFLESPSPTIWPFCFFQSLKMCHSMKTLKVSGNVRLSITDNDLQNVAQCCPLLELLHLGDWNGDGPKRDIVHPRATFFGLAVLAEKLLLLRILCLSASLNIPEEALYILPPSLPSSSRLKSLSLYDCPRCNPETVAARQASTLILHLFPLLQTFTFRLADVATISAGGTSQPERPLTADEVRKCFRS